MSEHEPGEFIDDNERLRLIIESLKPQFNALIDAGIEEENARTIIKERALYLLHNPEDEI